MATKYAFSYLIAEIANLLVPTCVRKSGARNRNEFFISFFCRGPPPDARIVPTKGPEDLKGRRDGRGEGEEAGFTHLRTKLT